MKPIHTLLIGLIFFMVTSCSSTKTINPLKLLTNKSWALSSLAGKSLDMSQFPGGIPTLNFLEDGKLSGFTGCNNFSGNFSLEEPGIKLDPGAITKKMCPGSGEEDFIAALKKAGDLKIARDKLTLLDGTMELMSFVPKN
ncbi:META domain-containing protein [Algoriphagus sp. AGSA1]|uniref:META domain-containing protein n=1 Tax=Algoriphagus sp. AGSA1 TaxID=2907213 RepID=UPI001F2A6EF7|nr:META domain-containing protein [Algoriphagus sp. AGSA1]MCE7054103.1 META domain-containing protein [Algoriphagus sp. AGSA1]